MYAYLTGIKLIKFEFQFFFLIISGNCQAL